VTRGKSKGVSEVQDRRQDGVLERLLALHDELDRLDKKESYTGLSLIIILVAAVLIAVGMSHGGVYMEVNGLLLGFGGLVIGAKEISKRRRMRWLGKRIDGMETSLEEGPARVEISDAENRMERRLP